MAMCCRLLLRHRTVGSDYLDVELRFFLTASNDDAHDDADRREDDSCGDELIVSVSSTGFCDLASGENADECSAEYREKGGEPVEWGPLLGFRCHCA